MKKYDVFNNLLNLFFSQLLHEVGVILQLLHNFQGITGILFADTTVMNLLHEIFCDRINSREHVWCQSFYCCSEHCKLRQVFPDTTRVSSSDSQ